MRTELRRRLRATARPVYHRVLGPLPVDPTRRWRGPGAGNESALRLAVYGDCSVRMMESAHTIGAPVGWPAILADRLRDQGTAVDCSLVFTSNYDTFPPGDDLARNLRLGGDPDVVVVHTGGLYTRRVILPDTPRYLRLRDDVGRRLGRHVFAGYRLVRPVVRLAGRPTIAYRDSSGLQRFLADARAAWPDAAIVAIAPMRRPIARAEQRRLERRLIADARLAAAATGADLIDLSDLPWRPGQRLRCANGYNLNAAGSRLVAERLLGWLEEAAPAPLRATA